MTQNGQNQEFFNIDTPETAPKKPVKVVSAGTYDLQLKNIIRKEKNSYGNPYLLFVFNILNQPEEAVVFYSVAPFLSPGKKLWNTLIALGKDPKTLDGGFKKEELIGQKVTASLMPSGAFNQIALMWPYVERSAGTVSPSVQTKPQATPPQTTPVTSQPVQTKVETVVSTSKDLTELIQF